MALTGGQLDYFIANQYFQLIALSTGSLSDKILTWNTTDNKFYGIDYSTFIAGVSSVSGTANRITSSPTTGAVIVDIAATYIGQSSITTLGTITAGAWQGTVIDGTYINYNTTNLKVTSAKLNTIQDIATASSPSFTSLTLSGLSTKGLVTNTAAGILGTVTGTGFIKDNGSGTISYDNSTYLTTSSASTIYVPYTGATGTVDLGSQALTTIGSITGNTGTFSGTLLLSGNQSAAAWGLNGIDLQIAASTYTDTSSSGTVANVAINSMGIATLAASSATTYTIANTLYIAGPPTASTNVTITNPISLNVANGALLFSNIITSTSGLTSETHSSTVNATIGALGSTNGLTLTHGVASTNNQNLGAMLGVNAKVTFATGSTGTVSSYGFFKTSWTNNSALAFTSLIHYNIGVSSKAGTGVTAAQAGYASVALTSATNNTYILLGTNTIPSGNWGIYSTNAYNHYMGTGNTQIGSATATAGVETLQVTGTASISSTLLVGSTVTATEGLFANSTLDRSLNVTSSYATGTVYGAVIGAVGASTKNIGLFIDSTNAATNYGLIVNTGNVSLGCNDGSALPLKVRTGTDQRWRWYNNGGVSQCSVINDVESAYVAFQLGNNWQSFDSSGNVSFSNNVGIAGGVTTLGLTVGNATKVSGSVANSHILGIQSVYSTSDSGSSFKIGMYSYAEQTAATTASIQALEGHVFTTHTSGTVTLMLGTIGNINVNGSGGTVTWANSVRGGGQTLSGSTVTNWARFYASAGSISGTVTNNYSFYSEVGAGGLYINDASTILNTLNTTNLYFTATIPSIVAGTGAGTSSSISISGTNQSFTVQLTVGTLPVTSATIWTVTFSNSFVFPSAARATFSPANSAAALLSGTSMVFVSPGNTVSTIIMTAGTVALPAGTYIWNVNVLGN